MTHYQPRRTEEPKKERKENGRGARTTSERNETPNYLSIFINHFLSKPQENAALLKALFIEKAWSVGQISKFTGWPRSTIVDALEAHDLTRDPKPIVKPCYGWKLIDGVRVPHVRQQLIIQKIKKLRNKSYSLNRIAVELNAQALPSPGGKKWDHKTIKIVLNRNAQEMEKEGQK